MNRLRLRDLLQGALHVWQVNGDVAVAYRKYSMDYVAADDAARRAGRGMWRGKFIAPWEWRRGKGLK